MLATSDVYGCLLDFAAESGLCVDILLVDGMFVAEITCFEDDDDESAEFVAHA